MPTATVLDQVGGGSSEERVVVVSYSETTGVDASSASTELITLPVPGLIDDSDVSTYEGRAEVARITEFLRAQRPPEYDEAVTEAPKEDKVEEGEIEFDERYDDAVALVTKSGQASISMVQRHLRIGYNRAARIIETMEQEGIVGPSDGAKPREVLVRGYDDM